MRIYFKILAVFLIGILSISWINTNEKDSYGKPLSPTDFVVDTKNNQLIVVQKTACRIDFVDLESSTLLSSIFTKLPPTGICFDGNHTAFISCSYSLSEVLVVDINNKIVTNRISIGHGAIAPVLSPNKKRLYVANQYSNDISIIDLESFKEIKRIAVNRQPMTMDVTPDGKWLYVANFLPSTRADEEVVAADVSIINLEKNKLHKHVKLASGSNALRGLTVSEDGRHVFVVHNLGRFNVPTSQLTQGWMNTSAMSVLETQTQSLLATILLDEPERGAAGAWGVDSNKDKIVVSHSGTHEFSLIPIDAFFAKLNSHQNKANLSYNLTFLHGIRKRVPLNGNGPRAIKLYGDKVYTTLYFSDKVEVLSLDDIEHSELIDLNPQLYIDSVRMGEIVFNDANHCFQQWQSCNGCHPNDARTDGLNWDLLNDGIGNPKNCKSLLLSHETPPVMISGIRPNAETAVRAGFKHIQFTQIDEASARAVDAYLRSLKPIPSPYLIEGELSESAQKGKQLFNNLSCNSCHSGPYYTNGKKYKIGKGEETDFYQGWDTPTLIEVWRTAPYLHDGSAANLDELLELSKHGLKNINLNKKERNQLIEYILSL